MKTRSDPGVLSCVLLGVVFLFILLMYLQPLRSAGAESSTNRSRELTIVAVPGGGLTKEGLLPRHSVLRVLRAEDICRERNEQNAGSTTDTTSRSIYRKNCIIAVLSYGTTHKAPPLDAKGFPISEAS